MSVNNLSISTAYSIKENTPQQKQPAALLLRFPACETLSAEMLSLRELLTVLFSRQIFPQILLPAFLSFLICGRPPASDTSIPSHHLLLYALETGECLFCIQSRTHVGLLLFFFLRIHAHKEVCKNCTGNIMPYTKYCTRDRCKRICCKMRGCK